MQPMHFFGAVGFATSQGNGASDNKRYEALAALRLKLPSGFRAPVFAARETATANRSKLGEILRICPNHRIFTLNCTPSPHIPIYHFV
jgi:hypothetical protein